MPSPPSLCSLPSFHPQPELAEVAVWIAGGPSGSPALSFPTWKALHMISYFSPLVPNLQAVSCLRSCFDEVDTALPSSSVNSLGQSQKEVKTDGNALASHSQVAGSDEAPEEK